VEHDLETWVNSLPWVVERPHFDPGVRMFAVDCEPLDIRRVWLVTGLGGAGNGGLAVVLPTEVAQIVEDAGWAWRVAPVPADHVLVRASAGADRRELDALVLTAYDCAFGATSVNDGRA
jgi:hypothetical protein